MTPLVVICSIYYFVHLTIDNSQSYSYKFRFSSSPIHHFPPPHFSITGTGLFLRDSSTLTSQLPSVPPSVRLWKPLSSLSYTCLCFVPTQRTSPVSRIPSTELVFLTPSLHSLLSHTVPVSVGACSTPETRPSSLDLRSPLKTSLLTVLD